VRGCPGLSRPVQASAHPILGYICERIGIMSTEMDGSLRYATPIVLRELRQLREKNANLRQRVAWLSELGVKDALDAAYAEGHTKGEAAEREKCIKAICPYCREDDELYNDNGVWRHRAEMWWNDRFQPITPICRAAAIRDVEEIPE